MLVEVLVPPLVGLLIGAAVGSGLALVRDPGPDLVALVGGGAIVGAAGGVLITAWRGLRLRAPTERNPPR